MVKTLILALLVILAATPAVGLTVEDVVEMTRAGLGDEVIINQIQATHSRFDLTVDEIIALSDGGVSDAVLAHMIATAFEYDTVPAEEPYEERYVVVEEEPEPTTFMHLSLGYHYRPWSYVWWDYWWPPFDYYWYAGGYCQPAWGWRYRPWHYAHSCWWYTDWYDPCWRHSWWRDDCDRFCHFGSSRDRVRWKSSTPSPAVTLASSRTRAKAIRDADRGVIRSPLARLEGKYKKPLDDRRSVLARNETRGSKTYKRYGRDAYPSKPRTVSKWAESRSGSGSRAVQSITARSKVRKTGTARSPGTTLSKTKRVRSVDRSLPSIRSTKRPVSRSGASASIRARPKSSSGASKATRPSIRSGTRSKSSSPAVKSGRSSSGRSSGSKKRR